ncbi:MAG: GntR family transcriptional regulator [Chloroflexota bacterium]
MEIDRRNPLPLYSQLEAIILEMMQSGELKPHEPIPTESELVQRYGLSRTTVRQAVGNLVKGGYLYRKRGKGTFVSRPKQQHGLEKLTSFSEDMRSRGMKPSSEVLKLEIVKASGHTTERLEIAEGTPVWKIARLRFADGEPMCIQTSYIPTGLVRDIEIADVDGEGSLYELLENKYHLSLREADETLDAALAWPEEARLLGIQRGAPLMVRKRITFLADGRPVEFVTTYYRADRYRCMFHTYRD